MKTLHTFYSKKQAYYVGSSIFKHINGKEIEVTEVASTSTYPSNWDDVIYLGEVVHYMDGGFIRKNKTRTKFFW